MDLLGLVLIAIVVAVCGYISWRMIGKEKSKAHPVPYKVVKPPSSKVDVSGEGVVRKKRVCAVLGGTGFIGCHIVDEFVRRGDSYVYVLGRKFREERVNPDADALIQVDMLDFDGLVNALQGVDSLIDVAAGVPNVYTTVDDMWRINKYGLQNVIKAAQKAGVKNFVFISGIGMKGTPSDPQTDALLNSFYWGMDYVAKINGEVGMQTCVVAFGQVIGLRSPFIEPLVSGKMTTFPLITHRATFLTVEYAAQAVAAAEWKLAEGCEYVAGKVHKLTGEVMSFKKFLSLPTWPHKFFNIPMWLMKMLAKVNVLFARLTSWAPMGVDLSPAMVAFFELAEEELDTSSTYELLEVGPPPSMQEYVKTMVERYHERESKK